MTTGSSAFLQVHVVLSFIGILSGIILVYGLLKGQMFNRWNALFLVSTALTSISGFPLPPPGFDPPRVVGLLCLSLLALAAAGIYVFHLSGRWRLVYVTTAIASFYLNAFVACVQAFSKLPFLHALAPTQSEPPFVVVQLLVLVGFFAIGALAVRSFHPASKLSNA
jgi:hypothetical protein